MLFLLLFTLPAPLLKLLVAKSLSAYCLSACCCYCHDYDNGRNRMTGRFYVLPQTHATPVLAPDLVHSVTPVPLGPLIPVLSLLCNVARWYVVPHTPSPIPTPTLVCAPYVYAFVLLPLLALFILVLALPMTLLLLLLNSSAARQREA